MNTKDFNSDNSLSEQNANEEYLSLRPPGEENEPPLEEPPYEPPYEPPQGDQSSPIGWLDSADGGWISGWSFDPDNPSVSNNVHVYLGGPAGSGAAGFGVTTDQLRPDVNQIYGITGDHGFRFQIPAQYADGQQYPVYAYGIDTGANNPQVLQGCPKYFVIDPTTPAMSLDQVSPIAGAVAGGLSVTLHGSGFQPGAAVYFGNTPAAQVTVESDSVIHAVTPPSVEPGSVTISVINPDGGSISLEGGFTYVSSEAGEQAEVIGISPLSVLENTQTELTIRGRNLIQAYNSGVFALRGSSRCQVSFSNVTTSHDPATGLDTIKVLANIQCTPALEPLERLAIQVLASTRPEAANDGVVQTSKQMFTVLPKSVPVPLAYTPSLTPNQPNLVMVSGRNLDGYQLSLDNGAEVMLQKSDDKFVSGIVHLPETYDASQPIQLLVKDADGVQVDTLPMQIEQLLQTSQPDEYLSLAPSDELTLNLQAIPGQQFIGPTQNDSSVFSLNSFGWGGNFNWSIFEITIVDLTIILPIVNEVHLIPFFDGGGDQLDTPVLAEVGKIFRLRGAGLLVAYRVEVQIHIQVAVIIGFYTYTWFNWGFRNEFPEIYWGVGTVVLGFRIEVEVSVILSFLLALVKANGELEVLVAANLTAGIDFTIDNNGLHFDPEFTHQVNVIGINPLPNELMPCGGKFQLLSDNGQTSFLDSRGGYESFYFVREAGSCCVPWNFNMRLLRFSPGGGQETVQEGFQTTYCLTAAESPTQYKVVITSEPPPEGLPPTLVMDVGETATLKALAVPIDSNGDPTGAPAQDLRDLGYGVEFYLENQANQVLNPITLLPGEADAILEGDNLIRAAITSVRILDDEPVLAFWKNSIYGFRRGTANEEPKLTTEGLPVSVNAPVAADIKIEPVLMYMERDKTTGDLIPNNTNPTLKPATNGLERLEPHEMSNEIPANPGATPPVIGKPSKPLREYVLAAKITVLPSTPGKDVKITFPAVSLVMDPVSPLSLTNGLPAFPGSKRSSSKIDDFFTGDLLGKSNLTLMIPKGAKLNDIISFTDGITANQKATITPNQFEVGTKLVIPGNKVTGKDTKIKVTLVPASATTAQKPTADNGDNVIIQNDVSFPVNNEETYEEYYRVFNELRSELHPSSTTSRVVTKGLSKFAASFHTDLNNLTNTSNLKSVLKTKGQSLWKSATEFVQGEGTPKVNGVKDDRPLYYARLEAMAVLRAYLQKKPPTALTVNEALNIFEWSSRGLETTNGKDDVSVKFGTNPRKVLVTGYDPFQLYSFKPNFVDYNLDVNNSSGIIALEFDKAEDVGKNNLAGFATPAVELRTAIFPVRFRDFGRIEPSTNPTGEGLIEKVMNKAVMDCELIMTCSWTPDNRFNIDRFATRYSTTTTEDNEGKVSTINLPLGPLSGSSTPNEPPQIIESGLPYSLDITTEDRKAVNLVSRKVGSANIDLILNQGFSQGSKNVPTAPSSTVLANSPDSYKKSVNPDRNPKPEVEVEAGPGGNYLSNEIFYRTANVRRKQKRPNLPTGHLHVPPLDGYDGNGFDGHEILDGAMEILNSMLNHTILTGNKRIVFENTPVGASSSEKSVTLKNSGTIAIKITDIETTAPFRLITSPKAFTIPAKGSKALKFRFEPTTNGYFGETADLIFKSGTTEKVVSAIQLEGQGVKELSFTPATGPEGTEVTITGTNFNNATEIRIGQKVDIISINSAGTEIKAKVTVDAFTSRIEVDAPGGNSASIAEFKVEPIITGISYLPVTVATVQGKTLTISGKNFLGFINVKIGGVAIRASNIKSVTKDKVILTLPRISLGKHDVEIITKGGTAKSPIQLEVAGIPNPPPDDLAAMWQGGDSYLVTEDAWQVQANGDLLSPTDNWYWARSNIALSQIGDWVEFDYTPLSFPHLRTLDNAYYGYLDGVGYYTTSGYVAPPSSFAVGDKIKFQIEAGDIIKVYKNGVLEYTFANPRDPNKPLYIVWGIYPSIPQGTVLKRPKYSVGGNPPPPAFTVSLTASPSTIEGNKNVTVDWTSDVSRPTSDWIGLYQVDARNDSFLDYQNIEEGISGSLVFTMPDEIGDYEFRYFIEDTYDLAAVSNSVNVFNSPPPVENTILNIWQGGSAWNGFNYTILPNDDVINPNGQNWFSIKSRIALSQVGDWVEYDHVGGAAESIRSLDGTSSFTYLEGAGFYGIAGSEGGADIMFATGDKFKYELAVNNQIKVYKNGNLVYTYQQTWSQAKPLYIYWSQWYYLQGGTLLQRPQFGGNGIVVD